MTDAASAGTSSPWSPLRHSSFRRLWIALLATNIGAWMQMVAAGWLMVELQTSPTLVALITTATYLPVVLVGVAAGALADLVDRRMLLLVTQAAGVVIAASLALVTVAGAITPLLLLGFTFALGVCLAFNGPAYQAIQPELVPPTELQQALTLSAASPNLGRAIGPAIGGVLVAAIGAWLVIALNAVTYAVSVAVLWQRRRPLEEEAGPPERFAGAVRAGVRYALFSHVLQGVLVRALVFGITSSVLLALMPVYVAEELQAGSGVLGMLYAGMGIGAVITAAFLPRLRARLSHDRLFMVGSVLVAAGLVALATIPTVAAAALASVIAGLGWLCALSTLAVVSQDAVPAWVRARGLSLYLTALSAGVALGSWAFGALASAVGVPLTYGLGAFALIATLALAWHWRFDTIARLDLSASPSAPLETRRPGGEAADSPTLVVVKYEVRAEGEEDFLSALLLVGRVRRRNGATSWSFYRDADHPGRYIETFVLPTWDEHVRQHQRLTVTDAAVLERVEEYLVPGRAPQAEHYIQPPQPRLELWPQ